MTACEAMKLANDKKTLIPAFNIPYLPMVKPIVRAVADEKAVAMVQTARLEWEKFGAKSPEAVAEEYFRYCMPEYTLLHLDHVPVIDEDNIRVDFLPIIERALKVGYQSVMVDASRLSLEENIAATRLVADEAHKAGAAVEAELGAVAGHESGGVGISYEELFTSKKGFTDIGEARRFVAESGCNWLSVAAGSVHGAIAENLRRQKKPEARLDIEHIAALYDATGGMPLVLHGGSGVKREYVLEAVQRGICKINVGTEIRQPYEEALEERPGDIEYAREKVYERTRWVIREYLNIAGSKTRLFG